MCAIIWDVRVIVMRCCCVLLVTTAVMLWLYLRPSLALPSLLLSQIASTVRAAGIVRERGIPQSHYWNLEFDMTEIWSYSKIMPWRINKATVTRPSPCSEVHKNIWIYWASEQFMSSLRNIEWVTRDRNMICLTLILILCWHSVLSWVVMNCNEHRLLFWCVIELCRPYPMNLKVY